MPASAENYLIRPFRRERVRRLAESPTFESTRISLSRVRSQYFKRKFPQDSDEDSEEDFDAARKEPPCMRDRQKVRLCDESLAVRESGDRNYCFFKT
jgi:hypothetical protein